MIKNKTNIKQKKKKSNKQIGFLGFLFMISNWLVRFFRNSFFNFIFVDSYIKINEKWQNGFIYRLLRRENKKMHTHSRFINYCENSFTNSQVSQISNRLIHSKVSIWGARIAFFSFSMLVVAALNIYIVTYENISLLSYLAAPDKYLTDFIVSGVVLVASILLTFSKREVGEALLAYKGTRFIVTDVLNLNADAFERGEKSTNNSYFLSMLIMFCLGFSTFFVSPTIILNILLLFATFIFIMSFPEIGILMVLICMPFATIFEHPNTFILSLIIYTICGFISKFIRGKRVLKFEFIDILLLLIGTLLMFGGVFSVGNSSSLKMAEIYLAFLFMYFLIVNMYIRKPGIYRGIKTMVICGFVVALIGLALKIIEIGNFNFAFLSWAPIAFVLSEARNLIIGQSEMGVYLVMICPLALGQMLVTRNKFIKTLYLIAVVTIIGSIMIAGDVLTRWGTIIAIVLFMLIYNFKSIWLALGVGVSSVAAMLVLPQNITDVVKSLLVVSGPEIEMKKSIWGRTWEMIAENLYTGIGVGQESFLSVFYKNGKEYTILTVDSHNIFLQVFVELGIVGFLLFIFTLFAFAQKCFASTKKRNQRSRSRTMICAGYASVLSACLMGLNSYIWSSYRAFLTFWIVFALTVALTKVNGKEDESERVVNNMISVDIEIG